jgi:hypothetical protein
MFPIHLFLAKWRESFIEGDDRLILVDGECLTVSPERWFSFPNQLYRESWVKING